MVYRILNVVIFHLSGILKRNETQAVFGSWLACKYADNPKYLFEYLIEKNIKLELIWCGKERVRNKIPACKGVKYVKYGTTKSLYYILTSKYFFVDHGFSDLSYFNLTKGAVVVNLGHGLTLKNMGSKSREINNLPSHIIKTIIRKSRSYDYFICSSLEHKNKMLEEFTENNIESEKVLSTGQPRNDFLIHNNNIESILQIRKRYSQEYGIPLRKKMITYLPTFRDNKRDNFSFSNLNGKHLRSLNNILSKNDAVIVEKKHFVNTLEKQRKQLRHHDSIITIVETTDVDTQELLLVSDVLITDYSGCYFDMLLLDRPIIHYAYDYDYYVHKDRGLYYDLADMAGGDVVHTMEDLIQVLDLNLNNRDLRKERRAKIKELMLTEEKGESCQRISKRLFGCE